MGTKVIQLNELKSDPESYLRDCCDAGEILVVELPDHRRVTIRPYEDDDDLINELIAENAKFQALLAKSAESPRKPFAPRPSPQN